MVKPFYLLDELLLNRSMQHKTETRSNYYPEVHDIGNIWRTLSLRKFIHLSFYDVCRFKKINCYMRIRFDGFWFFTLRVRE